LGDETPSEECTPAQRSQTDGAAENGSPASADHAQSAAPQSSSEHDAERKTEAHVGIVFAARDRATSKSAVTH